MYIWDLSPQNKNTKILNVENESLLIDILSGEKESEASDKPLLSSSSEADLSVILAYKKHSYWTVRSKHKK